MIVCSNRKIAYNLLLKFKAHYSEWFEERKTPEDVTVSAEELKEKKDDFGSDGVSDNKRVEEKIVKKEETSNDVELLEEEEIL